MQRSHAHGTQQASKAVQAARDAYNNAFIDMRNARLAGNLGTVARLQGRLSHLRFLLAYTKHVNSPLVIVP